MNTKKIVNFIFELSQLKRTPRSGWQHLGLNNPESVADHVLRSVQIGYILAVMEKAQPETVAAILAFHDNGEARIGDQNKIAARYFTKDEPERNAYLDQIESFDVTLKKKLLDYFDQLENRNTKEGRIAKDADWLETAFQAKEYYDLGHTEAIDWINNIETALETKSAKLLLKEMKKTRFTDWWKGLKKMTYKSIK